MASKEQLRAMREKYHLGEYRLSRSHTTRVARRARRVVQNRQVLEMPRRIRTRYVRSTRRASRRSSSHKSLLQNAAIGVGAATLVNTFVPKFVPQFSGFANMAGLLAAYKLGGTVGAGAALVTSGGFGILNSLLPATTTNSSSGATFS